MGIILANNFNIITRDRIQRRDRNKIGTNEREKEGRERESASSLSQSTLRSSSILVKMSSFLAFVACSKSMYWPRLIFPNTNFSAYVKEKPTCNKNDQIETASWSIEESRRDIPVVTQISVVIKCASDTKSDSEYLEFIIQPNVNKIANLTCSLNAY